MVINREVKYFKAHVEADVCPSSTYGNDDVCGEDGEHQVSQGLRISL